MTARLQAAAGLAGLAAALMLAGLGPAWARTWFYDLAWYSWLVVLDGLVRAKTGRSLIFHRTREFLVLAAWSVFIWLIFEHFNLRLNNWHYLDLPPEAWLRWPGYAVAFATVLPAIFLTQEALGRWGLVKPVKVRPLTAGRPWQTPFFVAGLLMFLLPLAWPGYFFPLVWLTFIFLLEPINHRLGARSLMADWERGDLTALVRLLAAGLVCGLIWEFLNFWAGAKWIYTIPLVGFLKIVEMPILGFLGFLPFALECYLMYAFIDRLRGDPFFGPLAGPRPGRVWALAAAALWLGYCLLVFMAIDNQTVLTFSPQGG
ncbi:MAG: hypothetical protein JRJ59_08750 [Deltaproteobacteria bacterium]|nr:hypothetical protein [Deltaproteobacteria bacterium]